MAVRGVRPGQMARDLKVLPGTVSRWRRGELPDPLRVDEIARYLGTTRAWLLKGEGPRDPSAVRGWSGAELGGEPLYEAPVAGAIEELAAKADFAVAQWSKPAQLCLDVGFGESRSVSLTFDKFGQTKEFSWTTDARAASVAGALAGIAPDAVALRTALQGPSALAEQKAEVDALETQQKLNKLRACRAILDAGGFNCDEPKE